MPAREILLFSLPTELIQKQEGKMLAIKRSRQAGKLTTLAVAAAAVWWPDNPDGAGQCANLPRFGLRQRLRYRSWTGSFGAEPLPDLRMAVVSALGVSSVKPPNPARMIT